ncbi:hypothetical protein DSO57_1013562 [Entomophthora muscae]|uniref:Uncharacterized protein n=1 Tax=Entomophthora muscae TaxID=34485 RepID=A0ACC2RKK5_9FUNG|nr:hypothetical protein DSO57_1013562 [Entomophthora muscae]
MSPGFKNFLGVVVLLVTACLDALGYNIQRRDHCKNNASSKPRHECCRKYWHLGLYIYVGSLVIGTIIGLQLIDAHCVAPLTTSSLIFNVVFARYLVGSRITRRDLIGTTIIIIAILTLLAVSAFPIQQDNTDFGVKELKILFSTTKFLVCIAFLNATLVVGLTAYLFLLPKANNEVRKRNLAMFISVLGGLCASETLIFANSGAAILMTIYHGEWSSLDGFSVLIVFGVFLSGVFQLFCLNGGLKLADSVLVSPIFSSVYNVFALSNTLIFLEKYELYHVWSIFLMGLALIVLVVGIVILARQVKPEPNKLPKLPRMKITKKSRPRDNPLPASGSVYHIDSSREKFVGRPSLSTL